MPSSTTLWSTSQIFDFLRKKTAGDVKYFFAVSDWTDGFFERLNFDSFSDTCDIPVTLVCNLARGNCSSAEIEKLLSRGARVYSSDKLVGAVWALSLKDEEGSSDRYGSLDFSYCGSIASNYIDTLGRALDDANFENEFNAVAGQPWKGVDELADLSPVFFDDPKIHIEFLEFIVRQKDQMSYPVTQEILNEREESKRNAEQLLSIKPQYRLCMVRLQHPTERDVIPYSIQIWLDRSEAPVPRGVTFGARGSLKGDSNSVEAFILREDGSIDFGSEYIDGSREVETNIYSSRRRMVVGEYFTFNWVDGETATYRVTQVSEIR